MSKGIDLVQVYDRGQVTPMYIIRGVSAAAWKPFEPVPHSYYVAQDDFSSPLFRSYEKALQAVSLITDPL
jgi:hypothetical protein